MFVVDVGVFIGSCVLRRFKHALVLICCLVFCNVVHLVCT